MSYELQDLDGEFINDLTVIRLHELLDGCGAPRCDDGGGVLSLRWRLVALKAEIEERP